MKIWKSIFLTFSFLVLLLLYFMSRPEDKSDTPEQKFLDSLTVLAKQGGAIHQYVLGRKYLEIRGDVKEERLGIYWLSKSAEQNNPFAQLELGKYYYKVKDKEAADKSVYWLNKAIENGESEAFYLLGEKYFYGDYVLKNQDLAVKLYKEAASRGVLDAAAKLGDLYSMGYGVPKNDKLAFNYYSRLINYPYSENYDHAFYRIAEMYLKGSGVKQNKSKAAMMFKQIFDSNGKYAGDAQLIWNENKLWRYYK